METDFLFASIFNLSINLVYTVIALIIGVTSLIMIDKKILKSIHIEEELKRCKRTCSYRKIQK